MVVIRHIAIVAPSLEKLILSFLRVRNPYAIALQAGRQESNKMNNLQYWIPVVGT